MQGDFWHANPDKYKSEDILAHPTHPISASDIWLRDRYKKILAEKYGNRVIYIWEQELKGLDQPDVMGLILRKIYEDQINTPSSVSIINL